jgi:hypothetical protein
MPTRRSSNATGFHSRASCSIRIKSSSSSAYVSPVGRLLAGFGEIGAQEIAPLAPARPSQPIAVEVVGKADALRRYRDDDQAPRGGGMGSGSAELHQQFLAAERHH